MSKNIESEFDKIKGCAQNLVTKIKETGIDDKEKKALIKQVNNAAKPDDNTPDNATNFLTAVNIGIEQSLKSEALSRNKERDNQALEKISTIDPVTGLLNKHGLNESANTLVSYAARNNNSVGIFNIDLTGFKPINDALGHNEGDKALKKMGEALKDVVRSEDLVARHGGDEFAIVIMNDNPEHKFTSERGKIEKVLSEGIEHKGSTVKGDVGFVTVSEGESFDGAMIRADKLMYNAKKQRKRELGMQPPELDM